ncbi:DUF2637 domain-containing protein [Nonomuraea sp. MTCD27]|uniref:DUF2637 domain-containing protein n=1 Tax=Nonomuraea sp. MTCD27 TaxID=1676747 RepID=UPI0035C22759
MNETLAVEPPREPADHPAEGVPTPSRWSRFKARLRHADTTPKPLAPAVETPRQPPAPEVRDTPATVSQTSVARRTAVVLAILLAAVIAVAFRGSWTSQSDAARAAHFDPTGAFLYPFAPDGLIVLALVGAVVLRHKFGPRLYCLTVVVLFTITSYVVNHLHGMGTFVMVGDGEDAILVKELPGEVVGLIAGQLVGSIAFGSHILMHVFRHLFPAALDGAVRTIAAPATVHAGPQNGPGHPADGVPADPEAEREERKAWAAITVRMLFDNGIKPKRKLLADQYGISERQVSYVIADVERERETGADEEPPAHAVGRTAGAPSVPVLAGAGSVNGHVPGGGN